MRGNRVRFLIAAAAFVIASAGGRASHAGGDGVIVQAVGDRLVVGAGDDSPGGQQLGQRVIGDRLPFGGIDDDPSFFSFSPAPTGFDTLPVGGVVHWDFLPITIDGVTSNLFHWDASGSVDFMPAAGEKLSLFDVTNSIPKTIGGTAAAVPGDILGSITEASGVGNDVFGLHAHRFWVLQGEGGDPLLGGGDDPASGVYLTAMRLRLDGYVPTEPFFVALGTFDTATSTIDNDVVPWIDARVDDLILEGDYNFNGEVDLADYQLWQTQYGAMTPQPVDIGEADGNGDGRIDAADYTVWRDNYLADPPPVATLAAPEPSGAALALALIGVLATRGQNQGRRVLTRLA